MVDKVCPLGSQILVSVIVPIYNAEKYLNQCLSSIREQAYSNLEIICINDGSTDDSLAIVAKHAALDDRIRIIDKENAGYGAGCNRGMDEAHGEWLAIVEPDDWIEPGMYADMLSFASTYDGAIDVIKTPWWNINDWDRSDSEQTRARCPLTVRMGASFGPFALSEHPVLIEHHPAIWSAIYRLDFLREHHIRFPEYPGAGWADNPFLIDTLCQAESIVYLNKAYYCYRADLPGSTRNHATNAAIRLPFDRWLDMLGCMQRIGVRDSAIIESHYIRGFRYLDGAMYDDGADNPVVLEGMRSMFSAMDKDIVLSSVKISPKHKRLFCETLGLDARVTSSLTHTAYAAREFWLSLRTLGACGIAKRARFKLTGRR